MRLIDADELRAWLVKAGRFLKLQDDKRTAAHAVGKIIYHIYKIPAVDAVPLSELTALRDTLYDMDAITFRGLGKINQLISKYGGQGSNTIPDERRWLETV